MTFKKQIISIEGNIGVGKSTLVNMLKELFQDNVEIIFEPIEDWINIVDDDGKNILETFYNDKKRWSYTFQNVAYITRMNKIVEALNNSTKKYIILDRSLDADLNTFAKMLYDDKFISEIEWNAYNKWNKFFFDNFGKEFNHQIIYLRCDPKVCQKRILKRGRKSEENISIQYLESVHKYHEEWLINKAKNVIVIDSNQDFIDDKENLTKLFSDLIQHTDPPKNTQ
ncbi:deoxynucleoside kinase [Catovirus CTV1]|uniref:Deoxynucleoside kinase n=1 Tax=Catovirus CTV1 TaxID=1977631 RepID=A0A1V0S992_9VIRU|nr:deoxynucleoside kinase [Catovirus CTV1]